MDVVSPRCPACWAEGVITRPTFGPAGGKAVSCSGHKEEGHVDVVHPRCPACEAEGVIKIASFGPEGGTKRERCQLHHLSGDVRLSSQLQ